MSVADYAIATKDLTKVYGRHVRAVDRLNLSVRRGEVYRFLGPSGAGKTTTLRMLLGWSTPLPAPRSCRAERRAIPRTCSVCARLWKNPLLPVPVRPGKPAGDGALTGPVRGGH
jgi:ABC-type glutathione transport system ATPase component